MGSSVFLTMVGFTVATTILVLVVSLCAPTPVSRIGEAIFDDHRPRIRLLTQVLFTRRNRDAITIDCLLLEVTQAGPGVAAPSGMPFTLQFHTPDTVWFADRVEHLLQDWANNNHELVVELREDHGKVRTLISSGPSSVHLELAGAAGLSLTS